MKILASDFDLTLFVENQPDVITKNIEVISKFMKKGNLFCIVTGRNYSDIKLLLNQYKIPYHYLICEDGAKLFDHNDFCFYTQNLASSDVEKIVKIASEENFSYYLDDGYNITQNSNDCVKVVLTFADRQQALYILNKINESVDVYAYISREHINILHSSVNKQNGLRKVLEKENKPATDLYVIGDSVNDLEMLQTFQGAIMKNHTDELKCLDKMQYNYLYEYIEELGKN